MPRSPTSASAAVALLLLASRAAAAPPPNFIVVLVDDWGWGDLGANGFGAETPSMDRYAARGVRFTDMHANSVCTPTRSALQTGRLNMRMGVTGNFDVDSKGGLAAGEITVAQLLQSGANYSTSATGKWCVHVVVSAEAVAEAVVEAVADAVAIAVADAVTDAVADAVAEAVAGAGAPSYCRGLHANRPHRARSLHAQAPWPQLGRRAPRRRLPPDVARLRLLRGCALQH